MFEEVVGDGLVFVVGVEEGVVCGVELVDVG